MKLTVSIEVLFPKCRCNVLTSLADMARLEEGLTRPSVPELLPYGAIMVCRPRMLPRLSVVNRSGWLRKLRLRSIPVLGDKDETDNRGTIVLRGCEICCVLIALYIS